MFRSRFVYDGLQFSVILSGGQLKILVFRSRLNQTSLTETQDP